MSSPKKGRQDAASSPVDVTPERQGHPWMAWDAAFGALLEELKKLPVDNAQDDPAGNDVSMDAGYVEAGPVEVEDRDVIIIDHSDPEAEQTWATVCRMAADPWRHLRTPVEIRALWDIAPYSGPDREQRIAARARQLNGWPKLEEEVEL
ncbi:hypothetical protein C8R47DRAFT_1083692 [Mycena vitilis]|nr:hypothetical protein C8R47DRAFT_1083692 [Mycena vitilis]